MIKACHTLLVMERELSYAVIKHKMKEILDSRLKERLLNPA